jgi:transcriptional regulator with XRE-family HTH domain
MIKLIIATLLQLNKGNTLYYWTTKNRYFFRDMTYFQQLFIRNLRYFRKKKGISQLKFSELIDLSPNYLNAVENGKNFPSPEVIQTMIDKLGIAPFQLFSEQPDAGKAQSPETGVILRELALVKQKIITDLDDCIQKYQEKGD